MTKYIKSVLWGVAVCLSYIQDAWCLKVKKQYNNIIMTWDYHITTYTRTHAHKHSFFNGFAMLWGNHDSLLLHGVQASCHNTFSLKLQILVQRTTKSLGKYGDHGLSAICFSARDFCTAIDLWLGALSWWRIYWLYLFLAIFSLLCPINVTVAI